MMNIWHPENFHGNKKNKFFEGWYFKQTSSQKDYVFAVIPGVSIGEDSHAFIQIIDNRNFSKYYRFKFEDFRFSNNPFSVSIDKNYFSLESLSLETEYIKANLYFRELKPWPVKLLSPGAMGFFGFFKFLECYHGILSFNHMVTGNVVVKGKNIDFENGNGYIEKDWGKSFPKSWIWASSNNFDNSDASFTLSIANVPFGRSYFVGFIIGFYLNGMIYQFTTYNGARIFNLRIEDNAIYLRVERGKLSIDIKMSKGAGSFLLAPRNGDMVGRIEESLNSNIEVTLRSNGSVLYAGKGINAGLEVVGDIIEDIRNSKSKRISLG
jgi:hypothetical protein